MARRWRLGNETLEKKHKQNGISATTTATTTATIATTTYCRSRTIGFFFRLAFVIGTSEERVESEKRKLSMAKLLGVRCLVRCYRLIGSSVSFFSLSLFLFCSLFALSFSLSLSFSRSLFGCWLCVALCDLTALELTTATEATAFTKPLWP